MIDQVGLTCLIMLCITAAIAAFIGLSFWIHRYQHYWPVALVIALWVVSWIFAARINRQRQLDKWISQYHHTNEVRELERKQ